MNKKNVLVTGSSRGIGRACALSFAKNGYHVFINCKSSLKQLGETEKEILSEDEVLEKGDLDGYSEENEEDNNSFDEGQDELDDGNDELFEGLDDEGEELLYGNDLANDNLDNDDDIIE